VPTKPKFVPRKKMKGKGKSGAIEKRKQKVHDQEARAKIVEKIREDRKKEEQEKKNEKKLQKEQVSKRRRKHQEKDQDSSSGESEYEEEEPQQQFNALSRFRKKK